MNWLSVTYVLSDTCCLWYDASSTSARNGKTISFVQIKSFEIKSFNFKAIIVVARHSVKRYFLRKRQEVRSTFPGKSNAVPADGENHREEIKKSACAEGSRRIHEESQIQTENRNTGPQICDGS